MLEDSSVQVLLSQSHLLERLPVSTVKVVCLDSEWEQIAAGSGENPLRQSGPENLAYVLFTSGSTGKPKGVMIEHKSTTTLIKWAFETFRQEHLAGVLASTSINFDLSVYELFVPLCQGGQIFLVENALSLPTLAKEAITLINTVPSAIAELSRIQGIPNSVKVINLAGEPLNNHLVQTLYQQETIESIYNLYGPSEDTTYSTFSKIPKGSDKEVNIGSPIANSQIYILDWNHNPTPPGIPGELCIAGAGLARGYLNRPELTKEKFIEIEVFGKPQRLYKTGDKARWLPDGNLEYLGRLDHQVKLRGFRIELSEIEVTLSQHETVKEAVVVLYNVDSNPRLVAYVTLVIKTDEVSGVLRTWLKTRLPEYMLPASVTVLDKLPLTPNGKIDRKALPAPDLAIQASPSAPRTETEHLLCHLWSQVLGIEVTSIQSHFFEAGGHSLLATQLVSRIRESFWIEMPLRVIFEQPILCEQAEWLDKQQRREELPPIIPLASGEPLVLSFAQQRLWFLAQLEGQSTTYNMPAALQLSGQLNETVLQDALTALIQRHDSLRLCFPVVDFDATVQLNDIYNPLSVTDLSELSETEQQVQVSEWIANHAQTPFQLDTGPLLSLRLLKLGQQEQILLFNMHHIISDGWSMAVLVRDWTQLYNAYAQNQAPQLSELPIQYTDYAAWQRNWLQGEVLKQQLAYWTEKLSKAPELLELPTDYPRPAVMRYQGKHLQSTLEPEITQEIKQLSQQYGVTVFMTLLAAFNVLLSRYSGQNDLVVGSPIANRTHHQTEDLIGFFVNTLVLRTQIEGEQTFPQLLKQVRKTALEAYSHQDIPFEFLVEQLNPSRSLSHSPLFQVMFVLQNTPQESLELSGLKMAFLEPENTTAKFDLTLSIAEHGDVFICDWEYNTDLFRPETITLLSEHFHVLLEGILNHSEQSLSKLPILTEAEQQQLLAWNQTETDYPKDQTIVDLFQAQVEKTPENIAVVFEGQALSYQVLNTKANQLAYYLMTLEVGAETLVGICVERSLEMVIGLLGILKAGGAYVPLDPDYPQQRLQFMLEDSSVAVLFSQSHLLERLPVSTAKVVCLDSEWEQIAAGSGENPPRQSGPKNLAYVIYTSGSTGMPKGVMIEHIGLTNLIQVQIQAFDIIQESRLLQFASFSFDASVSEMATTLTSGATLQLGSTNKFLPDEQFIKLINRQSITHVTLPPSFLVALPQEKLSGLETMVVAGEVCSSELVTKWSSGRKFINAYGPTESTVCATMTECQADGNSPPIGKPIANTKITILDANHNPTPLGIPGELCIAGAGLARGYLNRPELTAEKFIEIEVFGKPQRLYKTGDKARWLPDGNLEYQGRLDHQVSLRGFRIELSEIEVSLSQHEAVKEAVVVLYNVDSNPRLVAYVTLAIKTDEVSYVLRTWLKTRLPEYMLPASFTVLDKLLLTPNGKINRKALPAPDSLATNKHYQAPRDTVELQLAPIWENVLEVRPIGINDNFFELGGHSLLAIRLMAQIEQQLERHLPLATLFQNATIEQLANQLRQQTDSQTWSSLVAIQPNGTKPPFFCVPGVGGNVLYFYELAHHLGPDQPVYGLQAVGLDGKSAPFTRIEDMAAHYLKELQTIQPQGPYLLGGHSFGGLVAFEISLQLQKQGHEVAFLGIFDMIAPPFTAVGVKWDDTQWLNKIAQFLERELGQKLEFNYEILQSLDADAQLDYLNKQLKKADCLPPNAPLTQLRGLVNVFKANSQIQYTPIEITKTPITLFKAKEARSDVFENEPTCGWHKFSESGVSVQIVPGDHFTMLKKPHVQILAAQLKEGLEQALVVN
ncbi:MAG: non-ribosomal peptide synthetase [Candidatus Parabeggiatoa sp. nov. 1]|nr:MAG: non-ribosomal peptide synthetase [Gammaproteobacteria bacterium]